VAFKLIALQTKSDMSEKIKANGLTQKEIDKLYDIIEITHKILERHKIKYTIEGGTLLGAVRHGGLIPWDNDGDFNVLEKDISRIQKLANEFSKYGLEIIRTEGWGLQIAHKDSPVLKKNNPWGSKWPFLDLISIKLEGEKYVYTEDEARGDYPDYHLTKSDWEGEFDNVRFGHLILKSIRNRTGYLDRLYGNTKDRNWRSLVEINMNHRENYYYNKALTCPITTFVHAKHSSKAT